MGSLVLPLLLIAGIGLVASIGSPQRPGGYHWYLHGVYLMCRVLPFLALAGWLFLIGSTATGQKLPSAFDVSGAFTSSEAALLFIAGLLMMLPIANLVGAITLLYLGVRYARLPLEEISSGMILLGAFAASLAILGDQLPWLKRLHPRRNPAAKVREILIIVFGLVAIASSIVALLQASRFSSWMTYLLGENIPTLAILVFTLSLAGCWLLVALDIWRQFLLPVVVAPTFVVFAFITGLPWPYLCITYLMMVILCFSPEKVLAGERKIIANQF